MFLSPNNPDPGEYDTIDGGKNLGVNPRWFSFLDLKYRPFLPWVCPSGRHPINGVKR
jgi:hypothetical protein